MINEKGLQEIINKYDHNKASNEILKAMKSSKELTPKKKYTPLDIEKFSTKILLRKLTDALGYNYDIPMRYSFIFINDKAISKVIDIILQKAKKTTEEI